MRIRVTGAAGFVGLHRCERLVDDGHEVMGLDSFPSDYPRAAKEANLARVREDRRFRFVDLDLTVAPLTPLVADQDTFIHAAALPGNRWDQFDRYLACNLTALVAAGLSARAGNLPRQLPLGCGFHHHDWAGLEQGTTSNSRVWGRDRPPTPSHRYRQLLRRRRSGRELRHLEGDV